jgi:hypothetical protein
MRDDPDEHAGKPFTDTLGEIEGGRFLREATEQVREIVLAVMETRKKGSMTLKFAFTPTGKGAVEIDAKLDAKVPEHDRTTTTFFTTPEGTLMRDDPAQPRLPLRSVDPDRFHEPLRHVND